MIMQMDYLQVCWPILTNMVVPTKWLSHFRATGMLMFERKKDYSSPNNADVFFF
jgi:hypothetical protein